MTKNLILIFKSILFTLTLVAISSCGQQPKLPEIPGVKGPLFNIIDGKVLITIKLLKANLGVGAKVPIPKTKNSHFEVTPNLEDSGTLLTLHLDVEDLKTINIGTGDAHTLPDGRPIPGIAVGSLQNSLRADTELLDMSFYFHQRLFGISLPLGWETHGLGGSWDIVLQGKSIGLLGAVASDQDGRGAALVLFLKLETLKNKQLQELLRLSEESPETLY